MAPRSNTPEKNPQGSMLKRLNRVNYSAATAQYVIGLTQPEATIERSAMNLQAAEQPVTATVTGAKIVEQVATELVVPPTLSAEAFTKERNLEEIRRQIEEA